MMKIFKGGGNQPDLFVAATRFVFEENEGALLAVYGEATVRMLFFTGTSEQVLAVLEGFQVLAHADMSYFVPGDANCNPGRTLNGKESSVRFRFSGLGFRVQGIGGYLVGVHIMTGSYYLGVPCFRKPPLVVASRGGGGGGFPVSGLQFRV